MTTLIAGLFGLIIGSFLNVLVLRHGKESVGGRSHCTSCGAQIRWYDNIPLLSWFVLRGRCRDCSARISIQYPLVEALTGIIFALLGPLLAEAAYSLPFPVGELFGLDYLAVASLFIAIAIHDLRTTTIPDVWVYAFAVLALLSQFLTIVPPGTSVGLILLAGPIAALPLFALWLYSRGAWMGFGDVKLALGIGWLLGPVYGIAAVLFSFVLGAAVSVPLLFFSSSAWQRLRARLTHTGASSNATLGFTMRSEIPFGPFLVASTLIVWLLLIHHLDPLVFVGLSV